MQANRARLFLTFVLGSAIAAACSDSADQGDLPTPVGATPTPFIEINLDHAETLIAEGYPEDALPIYAAAAERGTEAERKEGLWALARIHSERGDNSSAEESIEALRASGLDPGEEGAALLLQGAAEFAQGDLDEAEEAFNSYLENAGPAGPYALLSLSRISRQKGNTETAIEHLAEALDVGLPPSVANESLMTLAGLEEEAGRSQDAIETLERAVAAAPSANQEVEALWALVQAAERAGDSAGAEEAVLSLVTTYPASYRSLEALAIPAAAALSNRDRALVLLRNRANPDAAEAFMAIAQLGGTGVAEAQYHLGILSERFERWEDAIAHYEAAINAGQSPWYAAQATWDKATVLERLGRTDEAIATYAGVASVMSTHEQAAPGVFRAGLMSYQLARPGDALGYWSTYLEVAPNNEERARANFWLAKANEALGDDFTASALYRAAIDADPLDYHAFRSREILGVTSQATSLSEPSPAARSDWLDVEEWLASVHGPEDPLATQNLLAGDGMARSRELIAAGMAEYADAELRALLDEQGFDPWLTYRLVREIDEMGRYWISSPAARSLVAEDSPPALFQLVYPLAHFDIVEDEAAAQDISPLLLLALIRQESLYQAEALSPAEAMGLTQVIPSTADGIAAELGIPDFRYSDLQRPRVSVQFGAHYLGGVLEDFGGVVPAALSAYNGGPGNAGRWWEAAGGDPDLFVETIDFRETRAYVELVTENFALYQYAYGLTAEPKIGG